jgi:putative SOS response-associated peptidase YedK
LKFSLFSEFVAVVSTMCGRTAQTHAAVVAAATILGAPQPRQTEDVDESASNNNSDDARDEQNHSQSKLAADNNSSKQRLGSPKDNYNICPGMGAEVFYKKDGAIVTESKLWGLITKHGTTKNPLPRGMGQHFSALMFNARSDTLYIKPTFCNLISKQQSCLVAVDGWFEWKQEVKGKKQPYYVRSKHQKYCLLPGLWARVATGHAEDPWLTTFTILTTEAAPPLRWLHSRMPVCCFDNDLARQWIESPTQQVHEALLKSNYDHSSPVSKSQDDKWEWHAVTDEMTNLKFRSSKAILPFQRESIKNFFGAAAAKQPTKSEVTSPSTSTPAKRPASESSSSPSIKPMSKKAKTSPKKGSIQSFFYPKSKHS